MPVQKKLIQLSMMAQKGKVISIMVKLPGIVLQRQVPQLLSNKTLPIM